MNNVNLKGNILLIMLDVCLKSLLLTLFVLVFSFPVLANELSQSVEDDFPIPEFDCVIEPSEIVDVGSAVTGVIKHIHVNRSDPVKKGAVIAALQPNVELATLKLTKMRANQNIAIKLRREIAKLSHQTQERNQALAHKSVISMQDMETFKTETRIAELQVEQEKANKQIAKLEYMRALAVLQQRTIRSPVDGVVMELFKSAGEYVEDKPLLRLAQLDPLHVELIVPVEYLGQISPGMQAKVTSVLPDAKTRLATVERVDMVADAASGTYGVRLTLPNPDYKIPAGLRCRADFVLPAQSRKTDEVAVETDSSDSTTSNTSLTRELIIPISNNVVPDCDSGKTCSMLDDANDRQLSGQLDQKYQTAATKQGKQDSVNRYLVLAIPKLDRQQTHVLQDNLRAASISDHYIIRQGIYIARLALGFYRNQKNANNRQHMLAGKGFNTEIVPITQSWFDEPHEATKY